MSIDKAVLSPMDTVDESLMCGRMFEWSVRKGYDSEKFCKTVMTSDWGIHVMNNDYSQEWADELFCLGGFEYFVGLEKGKCYTEDVMFFIGYLYRHWVLAYKVPAPQVYKMAPPKRILRGYDFLHTQGYDYVIAELTDEAKEHGII